MTEGIFESSSGDLDMNSGFKFEAGARKGKLIVANSARETPTVAPLPSQKTIGILTSGGDCAGLNAVIRAVVARAVQGYGWRVSWYPPWYDGVTASAD